MKQEEFFNELKERLSVIEESELDDILNEYKQHIEIKTKTEGISEEKVINDFGSIEDLSSEILEAYHIRSDFDKVAKEKKAIERKEKCKETADSVAKSFSNGFKNLWKHIKAFFLKIHNSVKAFLKNLFSKFKRKKKLEENQNETKSKSKRKLRNKEEKTEIAFFSLSKNFCYFIGRFCWNLFFGIITAIFAIMFCVCVVSFGASIFIIKGINFSLWGITLFLLGLSLIFGVAIIFFFGVLKKKKILIKNESFDGKSEETTPKIDVTLTEQAYVKEETENE